MVSHAIRLSTDAIPSKRPARFAVQAFRIIVN